MRGEPTPVSTQTERSHIRTRIPKGYAFCEYLHFSTRNIYNRHYFLVTSHRAAHSSHTKAAAKLRILRAKETNDVREDIGLTLIPEYVMVCIRC